MNIKESDLLTIFFSQKSRLSPDSEAKFFCEAGLDKDGFEVKYISDYKGIQH